MVQNLPKPLIDLYNVYIHGGMTRREFVDATKKFAVGGLTVALIMEGLLPNYALGEVVPKDDKRLKTEYITIDSSIVTRPHWTCMKLRRRSAVGRPRRNATQR